MIGRVYPLGKGFKGLVSYLETGKDGGQKRRDRVEWVEFRNLPTRSPRTAACMMAATASESVSGTTTPVYHFSISCDPGDPVGPDTLRSIASRTVRDLGLEEYEVLIFAHKDRSHPHLHFVVNRVHPERYTLWRPWWNYARIERSLRAQEVELGLRVVPGRLAPSSAHAIGGPGQRAAETPLRPQRGIRHGDAAFIDEVTARAVPVLERSRSWAELERGLAEHGLAVRVKGGGITLTDGRFEVKASEVGRQFSRGNLEKRFGSYPDYRARMAVADEIARTRSPIPPTANPQDSAGQAPASADPPVPQPESRVLGGDRPQFGDAGHGIIELFGAPEPPVAGQFGNAESRPAPDPQPGRGTGFPQEAKQRATPVFKKAQSWAELEQGLSDRGLSLRVKGGGFVVTDGEREVKASEIGRLFSRFHLEKRFGHYPDPGTSVPTPGAPEPTDTDAGAPLEPGVSPTPGADAKPLAAPSPASAPKPNRAPSPRADEQLAITFEQPATPAAPPIRIREPVAPVQLGLPLAEPPAPPRRQEERPPVTAPISPAALPAPSPDVVPQAPEPSPPGPSEPIPPTTQPVRPTEQPAPSSLEPLPPQRVPLPPELLQASELLREGLASYEAERMESLTRIAADEAAAKLNRFRNLNDTASADAKRLREALDRVFTDSPRAAGELNGYVRTHGWEALRSALKQSLQQFGTLRYPRPWYTFGPGRRDVEGIIDPLKMAMKSVPERPTQSQLDSTEVHARDTAQTHNDARDARRALRNPVQYEHEAADALRPLLRDASPEWIARQLASFLPPEDREAAEMAERVLKLALVVTRTRTRHPGRGIDF